MPARKARVNGGALPPPSDQQVEPTQPLSVESATDSDEIEEMLAALDHGPAAEEQGSQEADAFESALRSVPPAPPRRRAGQGAGGMGRRELKTELARAWLIQLRALHNEEALEDRGRWWAPRDFLRNCPRLGALYRGANAAGDALGRGRGKEGGLGLARDGQGRVAPSRENALRCIRHLRQVGWSDEQVAGLVGLEHAPFKSWVLGLPGDDHFFPAPPEGPLEEVGREQP
jgi:hypothetical protein